MTWYGFSEQAKWYQGKFLSPFRSLLPSLLHLCKLSATAIHNLIQSSADLIALESPQPQTCIQICRRKWNCLSFNHSLCKALKGPTILSVNTFPFNPIHSQNDRIAMASFFPLPIFNSPWHPRLPAHVVLTFHPYENMLALNSFFLFWTTPTCWI